MATVDELRSKPFATGQQLQEVKCSICGKTNEEYKVLCLFCGQRLIARAQEIKPSSELGTIAKGMGIVFGGYGLFVVLYAGALLCVCLLLAQCLAS